MLKKLQKHAGILQTRLKGSQTLADMRAEGNATLSTIVDSIERVGEVG